ncbi:MULTISPECIES: site-specific integrase [Actinosynnema]|uniref:tyrosine-type recombinase/integrase n=1 Tax=Actinosynnema TaxID=40566 RepID=UPI0020A5E186|nr:site-specific integrase [Actinosynnema pretiosum]MCP2099998.1 Phage integrase family protein [Actinosynnema pretiosum]
MSPDPKTVQAAQLLITQLGLTAEDLLRAPTDLPTFAQYVPKVVAASGPGAVRTYGTYWARIIEAFGDRRLDAVTATDIEALKQHLVANRRIRRNDRGGQSVAEHLVSAMRSIYTRAINDNLLPPNHNPALKVPKPRPRPTTRYALATTEVAPLVNTIASTGRDAVLDTLLFRLHLESACRRGGALALREEDLEPTSCLIRLREKNHTERMQPVSPTLMASLLAHREHRGNGRPTAEPLLRHSNGDPINRRRYDRMWQRLADRIPWVAARNVSTHWLRHTTLT